MTGVLLSPPGWPEDFKQIIIGCKWHETLSVRVHFTLFPRRAIEGSDVHVLSLITLWLKPC